MLQEQELRSDSERVERWLEILANPPTRQHEIEVAMEIATIGDTTLNYVLQKDAGSTIRAVMQTQGERKHLLIKVISSLLASSEANGTFLFQEQNFEPFAQILMTGDAIQQMEVLEMIQNAFKYHKSMDLVIHLTNASPILVGSLCKIFSSRTLPAKLRCYAIRLISLISKVSKLRALLYENNITIVLRDFFLSYEGFLTEVEDVTHEQRNDSNHGGISAANVWNIAEYSLTTIHNMLAHSETFKSSIIKNRYMPVILRIVDPKRKKSWSLLYSAIFVVTSMVDTENETFQTCRADLIRHLWSYLNFVQLQTIPATRCTGIVDLTQPLALTLEEQTHLICSISSCLRCLLSKFFDSAADILFGDLTNNFNVIIERISVLTSIRDELNRDKTVNSALYHARMQTIRNLLAIISTFAHTVATKFVQLNAENDDRFLSIKIEKLTGILICDKTRILSQLMWWLHDPQLVHNLLAFLCNLSVIDDLVPHILNMEPIEKLTMIVRKNLEAIGRIELERHQSDEPLMEDLTRHKRRDPSNKTLGSLDNISSKSVNAHAELAYDAISCLRNLVVDETVARDIVHSFGAFTVEIFPKCKARSIHGGVVDSNDLILETLCLFRNIIFEDELTLLDFTSNASIVSEIASQVISQNSNVQAMALEILRKLCEVIDSRLKVLELATNSSMQAKNDMFDLLISRNFISALLLVSSDDDKVMENVGVCSQILQNYRAKTVVESSKSSTKTCDHFSRIYQEWMEDDQDINAILGYEKYRIKYPPGLEPPKLFNIEKRRPSGKGKSIKGQKTK